MKHKKPILFFMVFFTLGISGLFAQYEFIQQEGSWYSNGLGNSFGFRTPNEVIFRELDGWLITHVIKTGTYSIDHEYNIPFINFNWVDGTVDRYLMLATAELIVLYSSNTEPTWVLRRGWEGTYGEILTFFSYASTIFASSTLKEGNLFYEASSERLGLNINRVWAVEGGIGESLYVELTRFKEFYISGGYVHFSRPYLFIQNSRPKKVRIYSNFNRTLFYDVELCDTPNFQVIIPFTDDIDSIEWKVLDSATRITPGNIRRTSLTIEILEVYPGTIYNHMCINSIVGFSTW